MAEFNCVLCHSVEYWLEIQFRTRDHAKHFACCCLLLECLAQLTRPRLHLLEQPRVLDGDNRLVGECLKESNLFLAERRHTCPRYTDPTDGLAFEQQRYGRHRSEISPPTVFGWSAA